jgi:hypothetical protein
MNLHGKTGYLKVVLVFSLEKFVVILGGIHLDVVVGFVAL